MGVTSKLAWLTRIVIALIFLQTLFFKFTGAPESIFIFSKIGIEPWGRYLVGAGELIAAVLLILPQGVLYGAILALVIIVPAIIAHLTVLGISVQSDGGLLFGLALIVFVGALFLISQKLVQRRKMLRKRR